MEAAVQPIDKTPNDPAKKSSTLQARAGMHGSRPSVRSGRGIRVERVITVNAPQEMVYAFWRDFTNLPRLMAPLERVSILDDLRSRWAARPIGAITVEWESELINDKPPEMFAWRSLEGAQLANAGSLRFARAPGNRGTRVTFVFEFESPAGKAGSAVAKLMGKDPGKLIADTLHRYKALVETGEIPTTLGQPAGNRE